MNKKEKGFTLIELIGVIVILLLLMLIATPIVVNYVKQTRDDVEKVQLNTIKDSAKNWAASKENIKYLPTIDGECVEVTLGELKAKGYVDLNITNPKTEEPYSDTIKVVIRKDGKSLTYEINETNEQVCETVIDTGVPSWIYVGSDKKVVSEQDEVTIQIKSNQEVDINNLINESIVVRVDNQIVDEAIVNVNCNHEGLITCDVKVSNIKGNGKINLLIEKDTLIKENKKSKATVITTDTLVDTKGPVITYKGRENTNKNIKYATNKDTITLKLETQDESTITGEIDDIKVYVDGEEKEVIKTITKNGNNYEIKISNVEGNGKLTVVIPENEIQDEIGNGNKETIITPGITIDNKLPTIVYNANGSENYSTYYDVEINVIDSETGIDNETLKYKWNTKAEGEGETSFSNNSTVRIEKVTGDYYLIGEACDNAGNCTKEISKVYKLSNEGPSIVLGTNGNTSYSQSASTKITVTSKTGSLDNNSLLYVVSKDKTAVPTISYANNETIKIDNLTGDYYIIAKACDNVGNCTTITSKAYHLDNEGPKIVYGTNGNSEYAKTGSTKITITDNNEIDDNTVKYIVSKERDGEPTKVLLNGATISLGTVTGDYYVVTQACDKAGNCTKMPSNIFYMDNTAPTIVYGTNGNSTYAKSHSTKVTATDGHSTLNTLKYIVSTSNTATPSTSLTNGGTVTINAGTGNYYVVSQACDKAGNCATLASNVFKMDNTAPTIVYGTNGNSTYAKSHSTKVTATDGHSTLNTLKYITGTSNTATPSTSLTNGGTVTISAGTGNYYVVSEACDKAGNCATLASNVFKMDNTAPTIVYGTNGNSAYAKTASTKVTATDSHSTLNTLKYITSTSKTATPTTALTSGGTVSLSGLTGTYYVVSEACDKAGNCTTLATNVFKMDNTAPTIVYGTNGSSTYAKSRSTTVTASDSHSQVNTLKYITGTSNTATPSTALTNGGTVTISGVTGNYYVVSQACDKAGNCATLASNVFKMDNTKPTATATVSGKSASIVLKDSVALAGYQVTTSASATSYTAITGTSKTVTYTATAAGTYYVHVKDSSGNTGVTTFTIDSSSFCAYAAGDSWTLSYTGDVQEFVVPCDGTYKLEVWGAQGGTAGSYIGGKGGYSSGSKALTVNSSLYIAIGGKGSSSSAGKGKNSSSVGGYNGGGNGKVSCPSWANITYVTGSGGGATHIAITTNRGELKNYVNNIEEILIVAGGGGGGNWDPGTASYCGAGGAGGGQSGLAGGSAGKGGTQSSGGSNGGSFGQGGTYGSNDGVCAAGGGGYYGGGYSTNRGGGGGGSGYIGDVTSGETIAGNAVMPTIDGTSTMTGNADNGYAKITLTAISN